MPGAPLSPHLERVRAERCPGWCPDPIITGQTADTARAAVGRVKDGENSPGATMGIPHLVGGL